MNTEIKNIIDLIDKTKQIMDKIIGQVVRIKENIDNILIIEKSGIKLDESLKCEYIKGYQSLIKFASREILENAHVNYLYKKLLVLEAEKEYLYSISDNFNDTYNTLQEKGCSIHYLDKYEGLNKEIQDKNEDRTGDNQRSINLINIELNIIFSQHML